MKGPRLKNEELLKSFGKRVREVRTEKGLTIEKLAELSELTYSHISRIEFGMLNISISTAEAVAKGLGMTLHELFDFPVTD